MNITKLVLRRPVSTALVILGIAVFGFFSIFNFDMELYPNINMPMMIVNTVYPGASPESIEQLITKKIEDSGEALSGVESVLSYSYENYSMVALTYNYEMDMNDAYTDLSAALDMLSLPSDAQDPVIMQLDINAQDTVTISASNDGSSDMMQYINNTVVPKLESVSNVAKVQVTGGKENYVRVQLDPQKMEQYNLSMSMIASYVSAADYNIPAGNISAGSQDVSVGTKASFKNLEDIKNITITTSTGSMITLADVATITQSSKAPSSISRYNGESSVSIGVTKNQSASTVRVANQIKKAVDQLAEENSGVKFEISYDAGSSITDSLMSVAKTLVAGVLLAMFVLFLFFGDWKASLIVGSSIPISLLATLVLMNLFGFNMNIITMGALVIAIGMIVDNSIVVIESCYRMIEQGKIYSEAAIQGAGVVMMSIVASTITTIVVYLPMSMIKGMAGQMFSQLGFIIVFAMLASLMSALCVVPLLFNRMQPKEKTAGPVDRILSLVKQKYRKVMPALLKHKKTTLSVTALLLIVSVFLASTLDFELIPATYDGSIIVTGTFRSGTKLAKMDEEFQMIEEEIANDKQFEKYNLTITGNTATLNAYAVKDCKRSSEEAVEIYQKKFEDVTSMEIQVSPTGGGSESMSSYSSAQAQVVLESTDMKALTKGARQVEAMMRKVPGVIHVTSDAAASKTSAHIVVDPLKAADKGFAPAQIAGELYTTLSGSKSGTIESDGKEYDIMLEYPEGTYEDVNQLMAKTFVSQTGATVTLNEIAQVEYDEQLQTIQKSNGKYQQTISATCAKDSKSQAAKKITQNAGKLKYPEGVGIGTSMLSDMQQENLTAIFRSILAGVFLVFLVMAMQFESVRFSIMVMVSIPFSLIGSFGALFLARNSFNMVSMMGFLMLMGIAVNNGILLVDTTNQEKESMPVEDALIKAGSIRLRPILMTTLTTILAMIPMIVGSDNVMMQGMALVIIGGLVASTLLCLLVMPAFYLLLSKDTKRKRRKHHLSLPGKKRKISKQ